MPVAEDGPQRAGVALCSRTNGWSWPPHPFQLLAWLLYIYFAVTSFGVFVPLLPAHWIPAGYIVSLAADLWLEGGCRWTGGVCEQRTCLRGLIPDLTPVYGCDVPVSPVCPHHRRVH